MEKAKIDRIILAVKVILTLYFRKWRYVQWIVNVTLALNAPWQAAVIMQTTTTACWIKSSLALTSAILLWINAPTASPSQRNNKNEGKSLFHNFVKEAFFT